MKEFLIAVVFALLGAAAMNFLPKIMKRKKKKLNSKNIMGDNEVHQQCEQNETSQNEVPHVNEARPASVAIIYRSELDYISRCILDYPNIETGGQLFGFWANDGAPVVLYAIGPGKNAQHNSTSFIQDWEYLKKIGEELHHCFRLQHIGEWHSHHQLGLAHPSSGDVNTMSYGVGKPGYPRMLLCIGNCTYNSASINAFNFYEYRPNEYVHAKWDIIDRTSPYREIVDQKLQSLLLHPHTSNASFNKGRNNSDSNITHWLIESVENVETMKTFVSIVKNTFQKCEVQTEMLDSGEPRITINEAEVHIVFPFGFPQKSPLVLKGNDGVISNSWDWTIENSLVSTFERWIKNIQSIQLNEGVLELSSTADMETEEIGK